MNEMEETKVQKIIFFGPPGSGKTTLAKAAGENGLDLEDHWDRIFGLVKVLEGPRVQVDKTRKEWLSVTDNTYLDERIVEEKALKHIQEIIAKVNCSKYDVIGGAGYDRLAPFFEGKKFILTLPEAEYVAQRDGRDMLVPSKRGQHTVEEAMAHMAKGVHRGFEPISPERAMSLVKWKTNTHNCGQQRRRYESHTSDTSAENEGGN